MSEPKLAIYIHWPFCKAKCPYCDFNSHVSGGLDIEEWTNAYETELAYYGEYLAGKQISSIFFGGGTPSLMPISLLERILNKLNFLAKFAEDIEITLEANPTSVEASKFAAIAKAGVNRISIGIQSFDETALTFLGRKHSVNEAKIAIELADKFFTNYSFDLIYARPDQTLESWQKELEEALAFAKYHISLYQLTIEKGTKFYKDFQQGAFSLPTEDQAIELYQQTEELLEAYGFINYEISNYAKLGYECRHNMAYWCYEAFLGIGAGAHSRLITPMGVEAVMNYHLPNKWLKCIQHNNQAVQQRKLLTEVEVVEEILIMYLRLKEGLDKNSFTRKIGKPLEQMINDTALTRLVQDGFLHNTHERLRLLPKGKLVLNQVVNLLLAF